MKYFCVKMHEPFTEWNTEYFYYEAETLEDIIEDIKYDFSSYCDEVINDTASYSDYPDEDDYDDYNDFVRAVCDAEVEMLSALTYTVKEITKEEFENRG